jgi:hypothetical protein
MQSLFAAHGFGGAMISANISGRPRRDHVPHSGVAAELQSVSAS